MALHLRIESGGMSIDSRLIVGDLDITSIVSAVTWQCGGGGAIASANVEFIAPEVDLCAVMDRSSIEELHRRCAAALGNENNWPIPEES